MGAQELSEKAMLPLSSVLSFSQSLKEKGYVFLAQEEKRAITLTEEGKRCLAEGLPEERVHKAACQGMAVSSLSPEEKSVGLAWASRLGLVKVQNGILTPGGKPQQSGIKDALAAVSQGSEPSPEALSLLVKRKLAGVSVSKTTYLEPSPVQPPQEATLPQEEEVNALTRQMLLEKSFRGKLFRKYDVSAPAETPSPAKRHQISRLMAKIRTIFSEMGFEEMEGGEKQSSFWNFDALFQPQDHPARDLADTFYLKGSEPLPDDAALVSRVKKTHEKCWGGEWRAENAQKSVLRTHTTAVSARYLYEKCQQKEPRKFFAIGKVYRNEATDYKHLAEFFQVEGIVVWEGATFRDLLGCLKEFYRKLGFEKIRFEPSYFPYTEPSLQVTVYFEKKKQWLEFGGAGIFRPEVSIPLCDRYPVLAWGLSLERPLMLLNDMEDIRDFYKSNAGWLREQKLQ